MLAICVASRASTAPLMVDDGLPLQEFCSIESGLYLV
jgi:hypothetical protein